MFLLPHAEISPIDGDDEAFGVEIVKERLPYDLLLIHGGDLSNPLPERLFS
jgi:hypothetical protein